MTSHVLTIVKLDEHLNPYVADFGVSREYGQPGTMTGIGTPLYVRYFFLREDGILTDDDVDGA